MVLEKFPSRIGWSCIESAIDLFADDIFDESSWQDVAVSRDGLPSESHYDMHQEIMVDSVISQSRNFEIGRELQRWVPDEDDPQCSELENTFDSPWNRWIYIYLIIPWKIVSWTIGLFSRDPIPCIAGAL